MTKKLLKTAIITLLVLAFIVIGVVGAYGELPWGWLNLVIQVLWVLLFVGVIALTVWDKLD